MSTPHHADTAPSCYSVNAMRTRRPSTHAHVRLIRVFPLSSAQRVHIAAAAAQQSNGQAAKTCWNACRMRAWQPGRDGGYEHQAVVGGAANQAPRIGEPRTHSNACQEPRLALVPVYQPAHSHRVMGRPNQELIRRYRCPCTRMCSYSHSCNTVRSRLRLGRGAENTHQKGLLKL